MSRPLKTQDYDTPTRRRIKQQLTSELTSFVLPWPRHLQDGNCKNHADANIFADPFTDEELLEAKSVCNNCPIALQCYEIGVARADDGVYGGYLLFRGKHSVLPKYRRTSK